MQILEIVHANKIVLSCLPILKPHLQLVWINAQRELSLMNSPLSVLVSVLPAITPTLQQEPVFNFVLLDILQIQAIRSVWLVLYVLPLIPMLILLLIFVLKNVLTGSGDSLRLEQLMEENVLIIAQMTISQTP